MFAYLAIYSWPVIVAVLFKTSRMPVALLASIIAGYLLLPLDTGLDLPALPTLDKTSIPALSAFVAVLILGRDGETDLRPGWMPRAGLAWGLIVLLMLAGFMTVMTNTDPVVSPGRYLPGLRPWDGFSSLVSTAMTLLPLVLARKVLAHPDQHRLLLAGLAIAGVIYSLPALFEVRMSPQLNLMVYGFFPRGADNWAQQLRGSGFRPLVFLEHGLWLSSFLAMAGLSVFGLVRHSSPAIRLVAFVAGLWLLGTLFLSKSLGALMIFLVLAPVILLTRTRTHLLVAAVLSAGVLTYPLLRGADLAPVNLALEWAQGVNQDRASSLNFRLNNEDRLLDKAQQRPVFGWGSWGRNEVYDETGRNITITDGYWIIIIGQGGWVRYLLEFGLLCIPALLVLRHRKRFEIGWETSVLVIVLTANLVDLIPNATITPLTWLIAGALWGRLELGRIASAPIADRVQEMPGPAAPMAAPAPKRIPPRARPPKAAFETRDATAPSRYTRYPRRAGTTKDDRGSDDE